MAYITLGSREVTSSLDTTGQNAGNYTAWFNAGVLGINVPQFELYHALVTQVPQLVTATIQLGTQQWSFTAPGFGGSEWDPSQPLYMHPGDELLFFWSSGSGTFPMVTCWFRYDEALSINKALA